ncbi:MAG: hypothetical protein ACLGPL_05645 [Acidobacteriota bacterium]
MKSKTAKLLAIILILGLFGIAASAMAAGSPQTKCPVMGYDINKNVYADQAGKRVYFCCTSCQDKFKADPQQYMKKLKDQGVTLEDAK